MDNEKDIFDVVELSEDELDTVVGGAYNIGDRVRVSNHNGRIKYCPDCGRLINYATGTIVRLRGVNSRGEKVFFVQMDCCGYKFPGATEGEMKPA